MYLNHESSVTILQPLTGKGSGPSCMTNPSITCVRMCGFTMAFCFSTTEGFSCFLTSDLGSDVSIFTGAEDFADTLPEVFSCCKANSKLVIKKRVTIYMYLISEGTKYFICILILNSITRCILLSIKSY